MTAERKMNYVHGHTPEESIRLFKQAKPLEKLFHEDLSFLPGQKVLEAGCGVGGQTVLLAKNGLTLSLFLSIFKSPLSNRLNCAFRKPILKMCNSNTPI